MEKIEAIKKIEGSAGYGMLAPVTLEKVYNHMLEKGYDFNEKKDISKAFKELNLFTDNFS